MTIEQAETEVRAFVANYSPLLEVIRALKERPLVGVEVSVDPPSEAVNYARLRLTSTRWGAVVMVDSVGGLLRWASVGLEAEPEEESPSRFYVQPWTDLYGGMVTLRAWLRARG